MRRAAVAVLVCGWVALAPSTAGADPPSATNYRTIVVAVEPAAPGVRLSVVGGDSFLRLRVETGTTVEVTGYRGEPFLRFGADGTVEENQASTTYHASRSRYGAPVPDDITATTPPRWRTVAVDGTFAWHDHRTHWMNDFTPPGHQPGDVILEAVVPLIVDGRPTEVTVRSVWEPSPSPAPLWWATGVGVAAAAALWRSRRSPTAVAALTALGAGVALSLSVWQFRSVPSETGPSIVPIALSAVAVTMTAVATVVARTRVVTAWACIAFAAVELASWGWLRRCHLGAAILPTDAPAWFDRGATTAITVTAIAVVLLATHHVVHPRLSTSTQGGVSASVSM